MATSSQGAKYNMKISLSSACLWGQKKETIFKTAKELGFDGIELNIGLKENPEKLFKYQKKYRLPILSLHQSLWNFPWPFFQKTQSFKGLIKLVGQLNIPLVVIHPPRTLNLLSSKGKFFLSKLKLLQEKHAPYTVISLENMPEKSSLTPPHFKIPLKLKRHKTSCKPSQLIRAIKNYPFTITLDTSHAVLNKIDLEMALRICKSNLFNIHLSNLALFKWSNFLDREHSTLRNGEIDLAKFLKTIKKSGYDKLLTFEVSPKAHGRFSFFNLKKIKSSLAKDLEFVKKNLRS